MSDDAPTTLDDYRVRAGDGRVILFLASRPDSGGPIWQVETGMTTDEARRIAADLIARADRVDGERS
jgi:hypothetical protein